MAIANMQVFDEYLQTSLTETLDQQIDKFNAATNGGIVLSSAAHEGDFTNEARYKKIANLVRRRNMYGSGAVAGTSLEQLLDSSVKVAAGTPPIEIDPAQFRWLQKSPDEAGVVIGEQLAGDMLQDMLNIGLASYVAASTAEAEVFTDGTGSTCDLAKLNSASSKFGDASQSLSAWVMHSKVLFDIYGTALANSERLFQFGNVQVVQDGFGRPLVITDSPSLVNGAVYQVAGLTGGAIVVERNNDFDQMIVNSVGDENLGRQMQSEWSYNLGLKGFTWDQAAGGKSPNDAALTTATNWDRHTTSHKDLGGVLLTTD